MIVLGENTVEQWLPQLCFIFRPTVFWAWRTGADTGTRLRLPKDPMWDYFTKRATDWHHHGCGFMPGATQLLYSLLRWATASPLLAIVRVQILLGRRPRSSAGSCGD
ncbi:hypothetical protein CVS27_18885 [Arthrobacter glacialis]|uniref:Uncharacterized protein n=1 Tax=Arthrobacter glacialis TaxID=1664 RepID=A0A2S3ZRJ6_ARTGL|nr:hypothetical protein CVS27_18885 [Arthrobacter glacialis]